MGVSDGNTVTVLHNGKGERIRLHGIDYPVKRQAFGKRAKQFTSNLVFAKTVTVQVLDRDRYGRTVGVVLLPDGRSLNHELVRAGLAWMYRRYTNDQSLTDLEQEARVARRRLFPILVFLVQHSVHSVSQYTEREAFQKEIRHPQLSDLYFLFFRAAARHNDDRGLRDERADSLENRKSVCIG